MRLIDIEPYEKHSSAHMLCVMEEGKLVQVFSSDIPTIEAEPVKHGRWVDHMVRDWRCSECGEKINKVRNVDGYCYDDKPNYCPN